MANPTVKPAASQAAKPQMALVSSTPSNSVPESKANTGSKANSLLGNSLTPMTVEARRAMIAEAAYYIAEKRGFGCGRDLEDWLHAERQIDAALSP